jgi:hypothetical protein
MALLDLQAIEIPVEQGTQFISYYSDVSCTGLSMIFC